MQRISYMIMAVTLFFILPGCGLVTFPSKEVSKENQPTSQKNKQPPQKNMLRFSNKSTNGQTQMVMKKDDKLYIHTIQERIITVINKDKPKIPTKVVVPIKVVQAPESSKNNPSSDPSTPTKEETPPKDGEEQQPPQDEKHQAAMKKAEELKGTDQQVTADQGNVYENPDEKSNIIQQVIKDQKLHIDNTKVDDDDSEIWCFVSGNDGQKDITGWVSYQILEQN
ncbi:SH3 domain-containing protein [Shimazuella sp. AN120528]|uniref:SH3 domain-containing protein n=1 Tax=Shimazuella soli TaxID=1892854 RepID=UPI001F0D6DCC|nr:SH3 domain-containing protein [Shimazuella soli]MCH5584251.1 SH3 domain-containing protein [Shimazuella soli]